jgi:hypothetical protein
MFGKLFGGKNQTPQATLPIVRNVTIGRTVILDPLTWRRFGAETRFALDRDTLEITAQGLIQLNDGGYVHRFYTEDEILFQAVSNDPEGETADDFTLFLPWASEYPGSGDGSRFAWAQRLRARTFQPPDLPEYRRFWFGEEAQAQDPVTFWEDVYYDRASSTPDKRLFQTTMLFHRDLADGDGRELMLALTLEPEGGDVTHEMMIGLPLSVGEFKA